MRIRTAENLLDQIDQDFAWRKKELATLKLFVNRYQFKPRLLNTALRAGITLLYAHWEGFLKTSSEFYLEFVSNQGAANHQLSDNFLALVARKPINDITASSRVEQGMAIVDFFRRKLTEVADVPHKDTIKTKSNLSSNVLREISSTVGVNYSLFETKSALIDERLLYKRNNVVHGQFLDLDVADFTEIYNEVTTMMETWRNELDNACVTKRYLNSISCP